METKHKNNTLYWDVLGWGRFIITIASSRLSRLEFKPYENCQPCFSFMTPHDYLCPAAADGSTHRLAAQQIEEYLSEKRREFDLPFDISSPDDRAILDMVRSIEYGETATYAAIAAQSGDPTAAKQVANALVKNPLPLIIPCHRIVSSAGNIGDYVWGRRIKQRLLNMEAINRNRITAK